MFIHKDVWQNLKSYENRDITEQLNSFLREENRSQIQ